MTLKNESSILRVVHKIDTASNLVVDFNPVNCKLTRLSPR